MESHVAKSIFSNSAKCYLVFRLSKWELILNQPVNTSRLLSLLTR